jgi:hypothetical protein
MCKASKGWIKMLLQTKKYRTRFPETNEIQENAHRKTHSRLPYVMRTKCVQRSSSFNTLARFDTRRQRASQRKDTDLDQTESGSCAGAKKKKTNQKIVHSPHYPIGAIVPKCCHVMIFFFWLTDLTEKPWAGQRRLRTATEWTCLLSRVG